MPALGMVTGTLYRLSDSCCRSSIPNLVAQASLRCLSKCSALCRGWECASCHSEMFCTHFPRVNEDAQARLSQKKMLQLPVVGRDWWFVLSAKNIFPLIQFWVSPKVTLECSSFPSWKPVWWSNILDCLLHAWSQLLQVTKTYPETGIFGTPGLQHLGTSALTAGDINKPLHSPCMCSSPAVDPCINFMFQSRCSKHVWLKSCIVLVHEIIFY